MRKWQAGDRHLLHDVAEESLAFFELPALVKERRKVPAFDTAAWNSEVRHSNRQSCVDSRRGFP